MFVNQNSPLKLAILGSGKGSNARALIEASRQAQLHYEVVLLITDISNAGILTLGEEFQIPSYYFNSGSFKTKFAPEREQELVTLLHKANIDFIALAGFMRVIKEPLLAGFPKRILNIHPSLLPHFPGLKAWQQAIDAGASESGCTVHLVDHGIDTGEILGQTRVPIFRNDTAETLHVRIQEAEHSLYPHITDTFAKNLLHKKETISNPNYTVENSDCRIP
ncbi:MAG: phosphoribosylglycinamide formyltransferase [Chthoniobacterales bacterium]|nr:phosphoribosylglycinamide formyltransferase [Chthoniobacterales bacterium]